MRKCLAFAVLMAFSWLGQDARAGVTIDVVFQETTARTLTVLHSSVVTVDVVLESTHDMVGLSTSVAYSSDFGLEVADMYQWQPIEVAPGRYCTPLFELMDTGSTVEPFNCFIDSPYNPPVLAAGTYDLGDIVWHAGGEAPDVGTETIAAYVNPLLDGVQAIINGNIVLLSSSQITQKSLKLNMVDIAFVFIEWVTVDDPGNVADDTGHGAVAYTYRIGKYEVTNEQYAAFLDAVAATDTNGLYSTSMGSGVGGITRSGSSGSYTYSAIAGRENMPVNYVSFYDSLRFANWLHNGQPTGAQDDSTTEDGAYDVSLGNAVVRKPGARAFLPSENEWYKAAYYAGSGTYYDYPAGSDTQTTCALPGATANTANCDFVVDDFTDVGSYTGSASPNGTFDQGGNAWEYTEASDGSNRVRRGGSMDTGPGALAASYRSSQNPSSAYADSGFRVASLLSGWLTTCGDGFVEGTEECDDDNTTPGDGCDGSCQIEHGWECSGEPSVCVEVCGNGLLSVSEQCDDDGTTSGDGCDASCQIESGWTCEGEPSVCTELPAVPSMSATGVTVLGMAVFGIGIMGLVIAARRRFNGR